MYKDSPDNLTNGKIYDISVRQYLQLPKYFQGKHSPIHGYRVSIQFTEQPIQDDPYTLGYNIGNDENYYTQIPHNYKCNTRTIQMEVLAGIIDYSGQISSVKSTYSVKSTDPKIHILYRAYQIIQTSKTLIDDIIFIARSLGYSTTKKTRYKLNLEGLIHNTYYIACIYGKQLHKIPTKRLLIQPEYALHAAQEDPRELDSIYPIKITEIGKGEYYGFEIDGNRRFVLGDFTVTHNTVMALKIISLLKQKTLIIVHKEFLLNQWIERIQEFLPGAKVGKIQGQIFDVEGKDIVLGMLQTLYDKDFSNVNTGLSTITTSTTDNPFASFGLTIIDEVHRIGSEQFSKTLLRVLTPYMLGISATVERKDKLTKILYMFIGPKIYTEKREDEDLVCVRAIEYASPDPEFNELVQDYKGNTQYSSMITKLCAFGPRCDFIVQVIADLVEESPDSQIMILAHNRCLLKYFYEAINHRQIAEVGYYVGGMKQKDLQTTENKQIVLATYAMAAEALDIKTLSTLIMATPKTDIIQSVGRILRVRHENPIVVDIVDSHDIFRNQWKQRKSFYKKCNYRIRSIASNQYRGMATVDWNGNDQTWKRVFEPKQKTKVIESNVVESKDCTTVQNDSDEDELPGPIKSINNGKCIIEFEDLEDEDNYREPTVPLYEPSLL
jgi:superfamily II DNA or RNA helicase